MKASAALAAVTLAAAGVAFADPEEADSGAAAARDPDYAAGKQAIERKDWSQAASRLAKAALRDPGNADLQNFLGFSYRNQGRYDLAFEHYKKALSIDPRHKGAHEYIGETYLKVGDLASAEKHLAALKSLCPLSCEPLEDLQRAVNAFRSKASTATREGRQP
jgi:Flp pilus assembly protein TadD